MFNVFECVIVPLFACLLWCVSSVMAWSQCTLGFLYRLSLSFFPLFLSAFLPFLFLLFSSYLRICLSLFSPHWFSLKAHDDEVISCCLLVDWCLSLFSAGDVLFQMAEVHRQIQVQLEEMVCTLFPFSTSFILAPGPRLVYTNLFFKVFKMLRKYQNFVLQLKCFHNELLSELEKKVELDARYLTVSTHHI